MSAMLENIPKPILYGGGALVVILMMTRRKGGQAGAGQGRDLALLDATAASMQLSAMSNIQALEISAGRDVELAAIAAQRYAIGEQAVINREGMALDYMMDKGRNKTTITLARQNHATVRHGMNLQFALRKIEEAGKRLQADQAFRLAKTSMDYEYDLDKKSMHVQEKHMPQVLELQLKEISMRAQQVKNDFTLAMRRLDIAEMQSMFSGGMGAPQQPYHGYGYGQPQYSGQSYTQQGGNAYLQGMSQGQGGGQCTYSYSAGIVNYLGCQAGAAMLKNTTQAMWYLNNPPVTPAGQAPAGPGQRWT